MIVDAKTKAECTEALKEGDELMNTGRLKQALPYYEKVMQAVDFKVQGSHEHVQQTQKSSKFRNQ